MVAATTDGQHILVPLITARSLNIQQLYNEPLMQFSLDNSFTLPREWFLNVQGRLSSDAKQSFGVRKTEGRVDAQLTKSFLKDHSLRVSLVANDIFRTGKYHFYVYGDRTYNEFEQYADNQRFRHPPQLPVQCHQE